MTGRTEFLLPFLAAVLLAGSLLLPAPGVAGEYVVKQCAGSGYSGFEGVPSLLGEVDRVDFGTGCNPGGAQQVGVYQDRSNRTMSDGVGGQYGWSAPAGAAIVATWFDVTMKDANGIKTSPVGSRTSGAGVYLDGGQAHDGTRVSAKWADQNDPLRRAAARLVCRRAAGCANRPDSVKSYITVFDARFDLRDDGYPEISTNGIVPPGSGEPWLRGVLPASVEARDTGGGISMVFAEINGLNRLLDPMVACPGLAGFGPTAYSVSMQPCPAVVERTGRIDSRVEPFREGSNRVKFCAEDFATGSSRRNRGCSPIRTVRIDNLPPAPPVGLQTAGGSDWRAENGFRFTWDDPEGQVSPITGGRYRLLDRATGQIAGEGDLDGAPGELGPLTMPGPGEYELELRLEDAAGNTGDPATAIARFDDRPPGNVAPEAPAGWVSADELPLRQTVERAEPRGPSGVGGYALAVSESGPVTPCPSGVCLDPPFALTGGIEDRTGVIPGLAEGRHWVSAVATSGAAVSSEQPGSTPVDVDRTAPRLSLAGVPVGWSNRPVTLTATATDELSGMTARPAEDDGEPETVIQTEGLAPYRVPGANASFTVTAEGVSLIRYWARDLAGNANDGERGPDGMRHPVPPEAVVRIDTEPPEPIFVRRRDPADPERVELVVRDHGSGTARAEIGYRKAGSGDPFTTLATTPGEDGRFTARIPSDDLPAGSYELSATGTDRAGNVGSGDRAEDGAPMLLRLPLKQPVTVTAGFGWQRRQRMVTGFGRRVLLTGRLTSGRSGLPGAGLTVTESFAAGSRRTKRSTMVKTDGTGHFALRLRPGPGRRVTVLYPGTRVRSRADGPVLRLRSRGRITLNVRPARILNGGRVKMSGRVKPGGARVPARGKVVAIQYFDPGRSRWRPVEVLRTSRNGRYSYRYRFRTIATAQRILFRSVALAEAGWPYLHSTSRRRSVIVFPKR